MAFKDDIYLNQFTVVTLSSASHFRDQNELFPSEKYHLKEATDFGDPSNSDYSNEPDFESPRKRENKQNFNHLHGQKC